MWPLFSRPLRTRHPVTRFTGLAIKRKKTTLKKGTECPQFNANLTFDFYPNQLDTTTFLLLMCGRTLGEDSIGQTGSQIKNSYWGKVALGSHVAGKGERDHWRTVIQNPRNVVSAWYTVKWQRRWVKQFWLSSRHARVVCQVTKTADLGRQDQSIDLLIFQNYGRYLTLHRTWEWDKVGLYLEKTSPIFCYESPMLFIPSQNKARVVMVRNTELLVFTAWLSVSCCLLLRYCLFAVEVKLHYLFY